MEQGVLWPAVYGAVLSTVLALVRFLDYRRDRGKLDLRLHRNQVFNWVEGEPGKHVEGPVETKLTVTNVGRRRIRVMSAGSRLARRLSSWRWFSAFWNPFSASVQVPEELPKILEEGDSIDLTTLGLWSPGTATWENIGRIYVVDSARRKWYMSRRELRRFRKGLKGDESLFDAVRQVITRRG